MLKKRFILEKKKVEVSIDPTAPFEMYEVGFRAF